jgi:hypothetical protein
MLYSLNPPYPVNTLTSSIFSHSDNPQSYTPPSFRSGLGGNDREAMRMLNYADFYDTSSSNDVSTQIQNFLLYCQLVAFGLKGSILDDQSLRSCVIAYMPRGLYVIGTTIVVPENVVLCCDGIIQRSGSTGASLKNNLYLPMIHVPPKAHIRRLYADCNPDGVNIGTGIVVGRFWGVASATVANGGTGYAVGDKIAMANPSKPSYLPAHFTVASLSGTAVATVTVASDSYSNSDGSTGAYALPLNLAQQQWTAANGFNVLSGSNFTTTAVTGTGSGCTLTPTFSADFAGGDLNIPFNNSVVYGDTMIEWLRVQACGYGTDPTYGQMSALRLCGYNHEVIFAEVQGGYYGFQLNPVNDTRALSLNAVGSRTGLYCGGSSIHVHNGVFDTCSCQLRMETVTDSNVNFVAFGNEAGYADQGGPYMNPGVNGYAVILGQWGGNQNCRVTGTVVDCGTTAGIPAIYLGGATHPSHSVYLDINVSNIQYGGVASKYLFSRFIDFDTTTANVDSTNDIRGSFDTASGAIYGNTAPNCAIRVWDPTANGYLGPGGVYQMQNAGVPTASTGANKAAKGSLCTDTTNGDLYINNGTAAAPTWAKFTHS